MVAVVACLALAYELVPDQTVARAAFVAAMVGVVALVAVSVLQRPPGRPRRAVDVLGAGVASTVLPYALVEISA